MTTLLDNKSQRKAGWFFRLLAGAMASLMGMVAKWMVDGWTAGQPTPDLSFSLVVAIGGFILMFSFFAIAAIFGQVPRSLAKLISGRV